MNFLLKTVVLVLLVLSFFTTKAEDAEIQLPSYYIEGVSSDLYISNLSTDADVKIFLDENELSPSIAEGTYHVEFIPTDAKKLIIEINGKAKEYKINAIPLWLSIIPPLLTIILALIFKEVITSLFIGLFFGSLILNLSSHSFFPGVFYAFMRSVDTYLIDALNDSGHLSVIIFSLLIGAMVSVINKSGGMQGIVNSLSKIATTAKSGQLATWLLGVAIFFDDYANTLVVGKTMRPVTDKLKISREKLAYLVDSTAAPIASIALITTWIGAELGYISDGIKNIPEIDMGVYSIFLNSLSYSYYPILALIFILILILKGKDFGPMLEAENLARYGKVSKVKERERDQFEIDIEEVEIEQRPNKWMAILPIFTLLSITIGGLLYTGWNNAIWMSEEISFLSKISDTIGNSDSYLALLWGSSAGLITAIKMSYFFNRQSLSNLIAQALEGIKSMIPAICILILAWALAVVIEEMHTADFLSGLFNDSISPYYIPLITFILSAVIAFSTGSSWGTMAILYPLVLPLSWQICVNNGWEISETLPIFYNVVSSVLAGSVLGDHCSPISDTTILSSLASDCDHIQHVKTQMPYALTVGTVACLLGTIPSAYGSPFWINLPIAIIVLWGIVHFFGQPVEEVHA